MKGQTCPRCQGPVMTFGRHLSFSEGFRTIKCPDCGAELKRPFSIWLLLVCMLACYLFVKIAFIGYARKTGLPESTFITIWLPSGIVLIAALLVLEKLISYKFIPWKEIPTSTTNES